LLEEAGVNAEETIRAQITEGVSGSVPFQRKPTHGSTQHRQGSVLQSKRQPPGATGSYLYNHLNPILGDLPLSALDNDVLKNLVQQLHEKELGPKTISNTVDTVKLVVASLKVNGEEVYKRTWDHEYIDLPVVDPEDQNSEAFPPPEEMAQILDARCKRRRRIQPTCWL
jgi:hypothetical protein